MVPGKSIANYLVILLLLLCCGNGVFYAPALSSPLPRATACLSVIPVHNTAARAIFSLNSHPVKKDRIRIRYMGGECPGIIPAVPPAIATPVFIDCIKGENYVSHIASSHHFLFKLRGPPSVIC